MKKILLGIIACLLIGCMALATACGSSSSWQKPSLTNPGKTISDGGFVAETENYVYVINGVGSSANDNTFGAPVKGSLVAIDKSTLGGTLKAEVVVPKLFVASDYTAGICLAGGYVYYGTPSTDKNTSGAIANNELAFARTKLDGSQAKAEVLFTIPSLSTSYRIVENNGNILIFYNDTANSAIKYYDVSTKTTATIAKTDNKNNDAVEGKDGIYLSLGTVSFAEENDKNDVVLFYTVTVYCEKYYEEKANKDNYSRRTADYNLVYAVNSKGESKLVFDGEKENVTYAIKLVKSGYVFYTATAKDSKVTTYAQRVSEILTNGKATEIVNDSYVTDALFIVSLEEVYFLDKVEHHHEEGEQHQEGEDLGSGNVIKSTLIANDKDVKMTVALANDISTIVGIIDGNLYYYNSETKLSKIVLNDGDAKPIRVSAGTVNSSWYKPEFLTVGGVEYIFYCDNSTTGSSYVWFINLNAKVIEEDTDNDGKNDLFYLEGSKCAGVMTGADQANVAVEAISGIETPMKWTEKDGKISCESATKAKKVCEDLGENKKYVDSSSLIKLENCEKALALGEKYFALKGVSKYEDLSETEKTAYKTAYDNAVSFRQSLIDSYGKTRFETIRDLLDNQIKSYKTDADKVFDKDKK